jgi:hypothetical protein
MQVKQKNIPSLCTFCHNPVDTKRAVPCPVCNRPYHPECWVDNDNHCAILGCTGCKVINGVYTRNRNKSQVSISAVFIIATICFIAGLVGGMGLIATTLFPTNTPTPHPPTGTSTHQPTNTPTQPPTNTPTPMPSFSIQALDSWKGDKPVCVTCTIEGWTEQTKTPGNYHWNVDFSYGTPASIYLGWCAANKATLDQNWQKMNYELTIDGYAIDLNKLTLEDSEDSDGACYGFAGALTKWSKGIHSYIWIQHIYQPINDGWNPYSAGDYIFNFTVNVK